MLKSIDHIVLKPFPLESLIAFIAMAVALGTISILWKYRKSGEVIFLLLVEIFAAIWAFTSGMEFKSNTLEMKTLWSQMSYFGIAFLPLCYFLFTTAFSQKYNLLTPRTIALLSIIPFVTIPLALTNEYHSLVWEKVRLSDQPYNTILIDHGSWFWIFWAYSITLIIAGLYNLFLSIFEFTAYYKTQVSTLMIATLIPLIGNLIYITGLNPIPGFDWTPVLFVFTGLVITFGIVKYRMFDLVPFARNNLIDTMSDGVIIVNSEGFIEDYNPAVSKIFKLERPVIRNRFSVVFSKYENLILSTGTQQKNNLLEVEIGFADNLRIFQARVVPLFNRNRQFSGHLIQLNDVSSLKHTQNQLQLVNRKLEAEVEEKGRLIEDLDAFAHTVAHDLRSSLGSVYNFSEIIEECIQSKNTELLEEFSGLIRTSAKKAIHITNELLLLATVNHHEVEKKPLEMSRIFSDAQNQLKDLIKEKKAQISVPDKWPVAIGHAPWIEEIWVNYLSNALKYGGTPPKISVGTISGKYTIRFWIKDNGNGISPADQNRLFKKYSRLASEKVEGYGLGLSIVKLIAKKSGGFVGVESTGEKGEGACFWFELPAISKNKDLKEEKQPSNEFI